MFLLSMGNLKFKEVKKVLWLIMAANLFVAGAKIVLGTLMNSASVTADGFHSLADASSNIIGLIGIRLAAKPIDKGHPYGHRKYETLTGLFIMGMLVYGGIKIVIDAFLKLSNPTIPQIANQHFFWMVLTLCINIFVSNYENNKGKALNSTLLVSDGMHTRSDIYVTIGVVFSMLAVKLGAPPIVDPLFSLVVAGFILYAAYEVFSMACGILVDGSAVDMDKIEQIALTLEGVKGVHKIRSRGMLDDLHIDMHVLADSSLNLEASHNLVHRIENEFKSRLNNEVEVIIHLEPYLLKKSSKDIT